MKKNKSILESFKNAVCGIWYAFLSEKNLRFHFMIASLIVIFAYFFGISRVEWAVLIFTIALVFFAELINTALENAVDTATREYSATAKLAKDISAGAVFVAALFSVIIGFILFFDIEKITKTLVLIFTTPKILVGCLLVGDIDLIFLIFGGKRDTELIERKTNNDK